MITNAVLQIIQARPRRSPFQINDRQGAPDVSHATNNRIEPGRRMSWGTAAPLSPIEHVKRPHVVAGKPETATTERFCPTS